MSAQRAPRDRQGRSREEDHSLQHAAEHERPRQSGSHVMTYLVILFAVALGLMAFSFLMQQRANQAAIDNLQSTSSSAVESIQNLIDDNDKLQEQVQSLESQISELRQAKDEAVAQSQTLARSTQEFADQVYALKCLNKLRYLYNNDKAGARQYLADLGDGADRVETLLGQVAAQADAGDMALYNPQEAWQQLVGWLT